MKNEVKKGKDKIFNKKNEKNQNWGNHKKLEKENKELLYYCVF